MGARALLACVAVLALMGLVAVSASAETISFTKRGCEVWTAPANVVAQVEAVGSAGQDSFEPGGRGDGVSGRIARNAGERLFVCVDANGGGSESAGGGWSGVIFGEEQNHAQVAVLAAGGGGGGQLPVSGSGGDAGKPGAQGGSCLGGGAGTELLGGVGGKCSSEASIEGSAGAEFQGGIAGECAACGGLHGGGAGGGGYYGGGGGGLSPVLDTAGGGGGGSDFCGNGAIDCTVNTAAGTVFGAGSASNEAHVTLTTTPPVAPTVAKVSPNSGPVTGDKGSIITGTNFKYVQSVKFGGAPATKYSVNAAGTELLVVSPEKEVQVAGTVDITVTTLAGTSKITTKDHYKYLPVITGVEPNTGSTAGGEIVAVFGYGFSLANESLDTFIFGTTPGTLFACNEGAPEFCLVFVPAHAAGKVDVRATVNGLTSLKTKADLYTYK
jgi:hypothetical protein